MGSSICRSRCSIIQEKVLPLHEKIFNKTETPKQIYDAINKINEKNADNKGEKNNEIKKDNYEYIV